MACVMSDELVSGVLVVEALSVEVSDQLLLLDAFDDSLDTKLLPGSLGTVSSTGEDVISTSLRPFP